MFENLAHKVRTDIKSVGYLIPSFLQCSCVHLHLLPIQDYLAFPSHISKRINEGTTLVLIESLFLWFFHFA